MIKTTNLNKYYNKGKNNEIHVINDTSMCLPETGLVCILGESGSGKTTLLNTLGGLDDYEAGVLSIADESMEHFSQEKMDVLRTKHCAYVFQNYYLLSEHTVDYNIRLVLNMYDMTEEEKTERIDYVLKAVDMQKYKKRSVSQLSGGQQQRVAIARALAKTPKVIFADEPTGNLDEANTMRVMHILKQVSKTCLVVMVTHEVRLADVFADRIIRVESGKVVSDTISSQNVEYQYEDDSTIYLKEYEHNDFSSENVTVIQYKKAKEEGEAHPKLPLTIRVIEENGRYYIQTLSDAQVTVIQPNGKKQVLDDERPVISEMEEGEFAFELECLECKQMPKLSMKEILRVAIRNLKLLGKQQMFLIVSFVAMAVLFVVAISDILTLNAIDVQSVVETDERYLEISVKKNGGFENLVFNEYFEELFEDYLETTDMDCLQFNYDTNLYFKYKGFEQIEDVKALITGYSIADLSDVSEEQLVAGRMPINPDEIVIDTWVLENFIKNEASIAQIFQNIEDYIGKEITVDRKSWTLTIVGVCDTGRPNIYMDKLTALSTTSRITNQMTSLEILQNKYPKLYGNVTLGEKEMLISESYMEHLKAIHSSTEYIIVAGTESYKVVGTFPDDLGVNYVLGKKGYEDVLKFLIVESKSWVAVTSDKQTVKDYFASLPEYVTENLQIFVADPYEEQMKVYEEARAIKVDARLIITISIFVVSLILLYFSMKSNAMKKIEEIMVYRLIGIKKSSILMIFAIESMLLTCYTSLPAVFVTSVVLKFVTSIPSLELNMVYPWSAAFAVAVLLLIINGITGVLPIISLVRKPPAQLNA